MFYKIILLTIILSFSGCFNLERFRHEKYSCSSNDIREIIIRHAKKGKQVKINTSKNNRKALIEFISKDKIVLTDKKTKIHINRKNGKITLNTQNRYQILRCDVSVFKI